MDARLLLWEACCTCRGKFKSPDVRMCTCDAPYKAGLVCECGRGVLLIKKSYKGNTFWGCSDYKKGGCAFTKSYGSPHDSDAKFELEKVTTAQTADHERELAVIECVQDEFELEWLEHCRCGAVKELDTFKCYMQSEGGCGMLPLCPRKGCGGVLFLKDSKFKNGGKYWTCKNAKSGGCRKFHNYKEHKVDSLKRPAKRMKMSPSPAKKNNPSTPRNTYAKNKSSKDEASQNQVQVLETPVDMAKKQASSKIVTPDAPVKATRTIEV